MYIKPFTAMILAAGYGKRLNPITNNIPKPLVKIAGKTLLQNTIDFLFSLNCEKIIINTHYKHDLINEFIKKNFKKRKIIISYEKKLLDTAGGVRNALSLFKSNKAIIVNSDVYWRKENTHDIKKLINNFNIKDECKLLLVPGKKSHGIYNKNGDFIISKGLIKRNSNNKRILFYSGVQMISLDVIKKYKKKKISFNIIWDNQINKKLLTGNIMNSHLYHVGDARGLKEIINSIT